MTISSQAYFDETFPPRKKEPRYLAVIDKDSCTSCNACATVCPVDCIYEVVRDAPAQSYHVIDSSRCIGCQLCYRIPSESTERYDLELCPWNAIDMLHNPNTSGWEHVLERYWVGGEEPMPWGKLDEYGYQLLMNGELRLRSESDEIAAVNRLGERKWGHGDDVRQIVDQPSSQNSSVRFKVTEEGHALLKVAFEHFENVFLD